MKLIQNQRVLNQKKKNKDEPQFESECDECECGTSSFEINVTE